jgi:arsenate reductase
MSLQAPGEFDRPMNVLFLCTGNSARSILAEALLAKLGGKRFRSFSAGSHPKSRPHRLTVEILERLGYQTKGLRSKSWDEFSRPESPRLDFIFTVCGDAADETCPIWPGHPVSAHWGVEDPAAFSGSAIEERAVFEGIHDQLSEKIKRFVALDFSSLDDRALASRLADIGGH